MARDTTKFLMQPGEVTITPISKTLEEIIKQAPKDDKKKAAYISQLLKTKKITPEEAQIIIERVSP